METIIEEQTITNAQVDPSHILQTAMGFWTSKTLLTAVNMHLFTHLADEPLSGQEIKTRLGLHERSLYDFLDTLVALGFLKRTGLKETAIYQNTDDVELFLDKNKPTYIGGILEMSNNRLYPFWNDLEEALKTGKPQNESKTGGKPIFEEIYEDEAKKREFLDAMKGTQMGNFIALSQKFDFSAYNTMCDIGGAGGYLAAQVALDHDHIQTISYDLPMVSTVALENIQKMGLEDRVSVQSGDFLQHDFPRADVITMGNILHDWGTDVKKMLIRKAYDTLPQGGALITIENIIDDNRSENAFGLMMSLNMLIETDEGYDYTGADFDAWVKEAGFRKSYLIPLAGPASAAVAIK